MPTLSNLICLILKLGQTYEDDYYYSLDWNLSEIKNLENILDNLDVCEEEINKVRSYYKTCLTEIVPRCLKLIDGIFNEYFVLYLL